MLSTENLSAADIAAVVGNSDNNGFGGNGAWFWIIVLFLFANNGNWGVGNGNCGANQIGASVQDGFNHQAVMSQLGDINTNISNGFSNAEISRCTTQANLTNQLNQIAMNQQSCCCENRQAIADLKYTISNEAAATRAADQSNTQAILDKLCQQEIDNLKTQLQAAQTQINLANLKASQNDQTAQILADNLRQTQALEQYLNPSPIPAYMVQNPNCCANSGGCGCGSF